MGKTFWAYIQYRRFLLIFYAISAGIFLSVQFLSGQTGFSWYAVMLSGIVLLLFLIPDGMAFFRKHKELSRISNILSQFEPEFPDVSNLLEQDYTDIAQSLHSIFQEAKDGLLAAHAQNIEYYTLWVHQIKTPISALRLVLQDMPDSPQKTVMMQELFGIERYTDLALQYARLGGIASDLLIEKCSLDAIVRGCVKKYALLFIYKKLWVEIDGLPQTVLSDAKWLRFMIEQILSNAVKYTREGGVRIYAVNQKLVIEDSGTGIRPEDLPRIFEKGYTGYMGRVDSRASGIGLYLAKKVADALSIAISVESTLGKGTRVTLEFPNEDEFIFR